MIILRAFLRLQGKKPPKDNVALVDEASRLAGFDSAPFARVVKHVRGEGEIKSAEAGDVLAGYLKGMEGLVSYLDRYQPAS
jgi:hypothetical protein